MNTKYFEVQFNMQMKDLRVEKSGCQLSTTNCDSIAPITISFCLRIESLSLGCVVDLASSTRRYAKLYRNRCVPCNHMMSISIINSRGLPKYRMKRQEKEKILQILGESTSTFQISHLFITKERNIAFRSRTISNWLATLLTEKWEKGYPTLMCCINALINIAIGQSYESMRQSF